MIVSMWMTRDVVSIEPRTPIVDAANFMAAKRVRWLPVAEPQPQGPRLLGIISSTDIHRAFPADVNPFAIVVPRARQIHTTVAEIMNAKPPTTTPDAPIEEAARVIRDHKFGALPVLRNDVMVGLITESDIFRAFVAIFESARGGVRITFDVSKGEDTFGLVAQAALRRGVRVLSLLSSQQGDRQVCVVRVAGAAVDEFMDDLWKSGHKVLNVLRLS